MEEGRGPKVLKSKSSKVPGSIGPRYLIFKYELDSKEGPSCLTIDFAFGTSSEFWCYVVFALSTSSWS